jgi:hypothetical protein
MELEQGGADRGRLVGADLPFWDEGGIASRDVVLHVWRCGESEGEGSELQVPLNDCSQQCAGRIPSCSRIERIQCNIMGSPNRMPEILAHKDRRLLFHFLSHDSTEHGRYTTLWVGHDKIRVNSDLT